MIINWYKHFLALFLRLSLLPVADLIVQPQFKAICQSYELFVNGIIIFNCVKGDSYHWTVFWVICFSWALSRIIPTCYWIRTPEHSLQENLVLNAVYCTVLSLYLFVAVFLCLCMFMLVYLPVRHHKIKRNSANLWCDCLVYCIF
jgi:hypothetical protein